MSDFTAWYWGRVASAVRVPDASLGVFRWIVGLYLLLFSAPHFAWVDDMPRGLFDPPIISLGYVVGRFPPAPALLLLDVVAICALLAMTVGWKTRASTIMLVACRLIGGSFIYSFGKIDHDILLTALLLCMALADWGRFYSLDAQHRPTERGEESSRRTQQGLALFATAVAFGFLTAGLPKLFGWVDGNLETSGVLRWLYNGRESLGRDQFFGGAVSGAPALLLESADYTTALLEIAGFAALLWSYRSWRVFLAIVTLFHLANILILNISFGAQVVTYLAFVNLCFLRPAMQRTWLKISAVTLAVLAAAWHIVARIGNFESQTVLVSTFERHREITLYVGIGVCAVVAALLFRDAWSRSGSAQTADTEPAVSSGESSVRYSAES
jgi:hypothetical protein